MTTSDHDPVRPDVNADSHIQPRPEFNCAESSRAQTALRECEYRKEIRSLLMDRGFTNPGITMTRVTAGKESTYTVSIYVPSYLHLSDADMQVLLAYLESIDLSVDNSEVIFTFT